MTNKITFASILALVLILSNIPSISAFQESIVAAWLFEEGSGKVVKDATGHFDDGQINGSAEWAEGKFGKALEFDGSSTYVQVPFNTKFQVLNEGNFTVAAWLKTELLGTERGSYLAAFQQMDSNGTGRTWMGIKGTDQVYSYLGNGDTLGQIPPVGEWYHFAVVVEENGATDTINLYLNGVFDGTSSRGMETCEGDFLIGSHKDLAVVNFWEGLIDEMIIANRVLSEDEINQLMTKGVGLLFAVDASDKLISTWGNLKRDLLEPRCSTQSLKHNSDCWN